MDEALFAIACTKSDYALSSVSTYLMNEFDIFSPFSSQNVTEYVYFTKF